MKRKLKLLAATLLLSSIAFSQTAISKPDSCRISLPCTTASKIAVDLLQGDSAKAELISTKQLVFQLEQKSYTQEKMLTSFVIKTKNYEDQINLFEKKEVLYQSALKQAERDNKKLKGSTKALGISAGVLVISVAVGIPLLLLL